MLIFGYLFLKLLMMSGRKFLKIFESSKIFRNFRPDIIRSFKNRYPCVKQTNEILRVFSRRVVLHYTSHCPKQKCLSTIEVVSCKSINLNKKALGTIPEVSTSVKSTFGQIFTASSTLIPTHISKSLVIFACEKFFRIYFLFTFAIFFEFVIKSKKKIHHELNNFKLSNIKR